MQYASGEAPHAEIKKYKSSVSHDKINFPSSQKFSSGATLMSQNEFLFKLIFHSGLEPVGDRTHPTFEKCVLYSSGTFHEIVY